MDPFAMDPILPLHPAPAVCFQSNAAPELQTAAELSHWLSWPKETQLLTLSSSLTDQLLPVILKGIAV